MGILQSTTGLSRLSSHITEKKNMLSLQIVWVSAEHFFMLLFIVISIYIYLRTLTVLKSFNKDTHRGYSFVWSISVI